MSRRHSGPLRRHPNRKILIVGEGQHTEYNYFVGLRTVHEATLAELQTSVSVRRGAGGSAKQIVVNAIQHMKQGNLTKRERRPGDRVFLVMDTEGPGNDPGLGRTPELVAAESLAAEHNIEIIYSTPAIEYWFRCHFEKLPRGHCGDGTAALKELAKVWTTVSNGNYEKNDDQVFEKLSEGLILARDQALQLDIQHSKTKYDGKTGDVRKTNPSTQVYELIAVLLGVRTGETCPINGEWVPVADSAGKRPFSRGDIVPQHDGKDVHWRI